MPRYDFPYHTPDYVVPCPAPLSHPAAQFGQLEQAMAAYLFGDFLEDPSADWQHLWIDLGGEG
ncbi:MAG TPA: hypothetical protein VNK04_12845 [Gemmataceae bacterium]|jgi:hypothetical protein|nr:hypothetical protein [Gemmataceae bacterium]